MPPAFATCIAVRHSAVDPTRLHLGRSLGLLATGNGTFIYVSRYVGTHDLGSGTVPLELLLCNVLRQPARPQLQEISRTESILLLVHLDQLGKVDRFGFVRDATD